MNTAPNVVRPLSSQKVQVLLGRPVGCKLAYIDCIYSYENSYTLTTNHVRQSGTETPAKPYPIHDS